MQVDGELPQAIAPLGSVCQQACSSSSQYDLVIPNANFHHSGQYVCVAVHNDGMTTTKTCKVTVGGEPPHNHQTICSGGGWVHKMIMFSRS